jgi:hypothetical protein
LFFESTQKSMPYYLVTDFDLVKYKTI